MLVTRLAPKPRSVGKSREVGDAEAAEPPSKRRAHAFHPTIGSLPPAAQVPRYRLEGLRKNLAQDLGVYRSGRKVVKTKFQYVIPLSMIGRTFASLLVRMQFFHPPFGRSRSTHQLRSS